MTFNKKVGALAAMSSLVLVSAVSADDGFKVGGFVDPQLNYLQGEGARSVMNDGAIYVTKSLGEGSATFDLAFGDIGLSPTSGAVGLFGAGPSNKSQAFVAYKYSNGFSWKFGQFDGIFGFERNDTVDVAFATQGGVYGMQPVVHEALLVGYEVSKGLDVHAYVGGSDGSGLAQPFTAAVRNPQIGAKVTYNDGFRLAVGGLMESTAEDVSAMFINATAGMDFGDIALDAEYSMNSTGVDGATSETGIGVYAGYKMGETTTLGARLTMVSNSDFTEATGDNSEESVMAITVGPSFAMTKDLTVKVNLDYNMNNSGIDGVDAVNTASAAVAATYRF